MQKTELVAKDFFQKEFDPHNRGIVCFNLIQNIKQNKLFDTKKNF